MTSGLIQLVSGDLEAYVLPQRGGVLANLSLNGFSFLAKTPWAENTPSYFGYAPDETVWVARWMGGWQLCAPNTGLGGLGDESPAFHGAASQDTWQVVDRTDTSLQLNWQSPNRDTSISRLWMIRGQTEVRVETSIENHSSKPIPVGVAEHLILGTDFLEPLRSGVRGELDYCPHARVVDLDYSGAPNEVADAKEFLGSELGIDQQAVVFGLANPASTAITASIGDWKVQVEWEGLDHALIWKEFGFSQESPWNGDVFALGIEPTNVPHGLGATMAEGPFLGGNEKIRWNTAMSFSNVRKLTCKIS